MGRTKAIPKKFNGDLPQETQANRKPVKKRSHSTISHVVSPPNASNEQYFLHELCLGKSNNDLPESWSKCRASFTFWKSLRLEFDSDITVLVNLPDYVLVNDIFASKMFAMRFYKGDDDSFIAQLFITELPLPKFNKPIASIMQRIFSLAFNIEIHCEKSADVNNKISEAKEIAQLYQNVKTIRDNSLEIAKVCVQHSFLKPKLRPYQEDAVRWMLMRETEPEDEEMLHPLYQEVLLTSGTIVYFNKHTGYVDNTKPLVSSLRTGGILADEMGLGKTVEVLACILGHPKPYETRENTETETQTNHSEETNAGLQGTPTVQKQPKTRKRQHSRDDSRENHDKPKKSRVPEEWVKSSSKKSETRLALELWYENMLQEVAIREVDQPESNRVQCICGETDMKGSVMCVDCFKYQHNTCLGYKKSFGRYRCPKCWMEQPLLESKATLIVCPLALRNQWCEEFCNHVGTSLNVLVYEGSKATPIYPTKLKEYDLVLTTYNVLQNELRLSESGQALTLRREPRYSAPGSPLVLIKWWRLCLDEAQTVDVPSCMISTMAKKLHAYHRWAITGTPICQDISGLYGLVDYLQLEPYNEPETWNHLLYLPYLSGNTDPLLKFLAQVMWRSSKNDVIDQINIPKQTVKEHELEFSAVEKFYYKREHELCATHFFEKIRSLSGNRLLRTLDRSILKKMMAPLLSIRQACTHPNAARGRYLATRKPVTSMEGLLEALIEKNKNDSEENLRAVVSSLNGLAGLYLLRQIPVQAVAEYRKVLQLASRFNSEEGLSVDKEELSVDKLQLIHTVHNLAEVLETGLQVPPTLRDHTLREDCIQLQEKYMERYISQNITAYEETQAAMNLVTKLQAKSGLVPGQWYSALVDWIVLNDLMGDLYQRMQTALENAGIQKHNYSNERKLLYAVSTWDEDITDSRTSTIDLLNKMYTYSPEDNCKFKICEGLVSAAMNCHLRPQKKSKKCLVCEISMQMRGYEAMLFDMTKAKNTDDKDISNTGSWKPTSQELVLKAILGLGKARYAEKEMVKDGELFFNILDAMKKEFKTMRKFWTYLDQQICAHDEINICKIRLSLKEPNLQHDRRPSTSERILKQLSTVLENRLEYINLIGEHELDYQASVLRNEERQNMEALERNLGTHNYLKTLRRQQFVGQNPDPCPICKNILQEQWSILPCGHCYCLECIQTLLERTSGNRLSCSVCRQLQKVEDISYIRLGEEATDQDGIKIKGNYSTKVEAVVKLILQLRNEEALVKILVFSTWPAVLKILQTALTRNDIVTELMLQNNVEQSLKKFKTRAITTLLLPIQLGSKGLNLIEATHIVLVEPLLNPADELQAIGRVHRIGQTRPTTVHKFIVRNTIEESLHHATSSNADVWDKNKVTIQQLRNLFFDTSNESLPVSIDIENNEEYIPLENGLAVDLENNSTEDLDGSSIRDLQDNSTEFLEDNSTEFLEDNSTEFLEDTSAEFVEDTSAEFLEGNSAEGESLENISSEF